MFGDVQWWIMRPVAHGVVRVCLRVRVEGLEHLPCVGPVIVAARHYHHFFDACTLLAAVPRPIHFVASVDWMDRPGRRAAAGLGFAAVRWPRIVRFDRHSETAHITDRVVQIRSLRGAVTEGLRVLRAGHILIFFPEGYSNVDPDETPKKGDDAAFLPFQPGFYRLAEIARRRLRTPIPIVPVGFDYHRGRRWEVVLRFGAPIAASDRDSTIRLIEDKVRRLSALPRGGYAREHNG
jgi:1-acyl-sn-glycerol-3-phosphate acyltransferase